MDWATGISAFSVRPEGSNRMWENLFTMSRNGTPYWRVREMEVAKASSMPERVEPSLAMVTKISPGEPSSYEPAVMYPSCPSMENLWVTEARVAGGRRRVG